MANEEARPAQNGGLHVRTIRIEDASRRIQELEDANMDLQRNAQDDLDKMQSMCEQLEQNWKMEKEANDNQTAAMQLMQQEKQHLQQQINELQSAAGNMASTAESVHKWLEERTRTARLECRTEKMRADKAVADVEALTVEKQELVQQLNELHSAADNMVTTAAESVHQLVEERTRETLTEVQQEKGRADAEAAKVEMLKHENCELLERIADLQRLQLQGAVQAIEKAGGNQRKMQPPEDAPSHGSLEEDTLPCLTAIAIPPSMQASLQLPVHLQASPPSATVQVLDPRAMQASPRLALDASIPPGGMQATNSQPTPQFQKLGQPTNLGQQQQQPTMIMERVLETNYGAAAGKRILSPATMLRGGHLMSPRQQSPARLASPRAQQPLARYVSMGPPVLSAGRRNSPQRSSSEPADRDTRVRTIERQPSNRNRSPRSVSRERTPRTAPAPTEADVRVTTLESLVAAESYVVRQASPILSSPRPMPQGCSVATGSNTSFSTGVSAAMSMPTGLQGSFSHEKFQFIRAGASHGAGHVLRSYSHAGLGSANGRGGSLNVLAGGSRGGSFIVAPADGCAVYRSASNPVSVFTSPDGSQCSSRNNSLVPPARKRSEPAPLNLPRLVSGVPWQPSEDADVVIATLDSGKMRRSDSPMSSTAQSIITEAAGITGVDESIYMKADTQGQTGAWVNHLGKSAETPPMLNGILTHQDGNVFSRGGIGTTSAPQMARAVSITSPRMVPASRITGNWRDAAGASPLMSARGRLQATSVGASVPLWPGRPATMEMVAEPNFIGGGLEGIRSAGGVLPAWPAPGSPGAPTPRHSLQGARFENQPGPWAPAYRANSPPRQQTPQGDTRPLRWAPEQARTGTPVRDMRRDLYPGSTIGTGDYLTSAGVRRAPQAMPRMGPFTPRGRS